MKRYVHNDTAAAIFAGGVLIPPGEGREIDVLYLPPDAVDAPEAEAAQAPDPDASLRELLAQPLKDVLPELAGFSHATLDRLAELEGQDATPRKTLLAAIGELKLERAKRSTEGGEGSEGGEG